MEMYRIYNKKMCYRQFFGLPKLPEAYLKCIISFGYSIIMEQAPIEPGQQLNTLLGKLDSQAAPPASLTEGVQSLIALLGNTWYRFPPECTDALLETILSLFHSTDSTTMRNVVGALMNILPDQNLQIASRQIQILQIMSSLLNSISLETSADWLNLTEETDEKEIDPNDYYATLVTKQVLSYLTDFSYLLDWEQLDQQFNFAFQALFKQEDDWRQVYTALIVLSKLHYQIEQFDNIKPFLDWGLKYLDHPEPRIRWAALYCIQQIANHLSPLFSEIHGDFVLPKVIPLMMDVYPRVCSQACLCLSKICNPMTAKQNVKQHLPEIFKAASFHLEGENPKVNELFFLLSSLGSASFGLGDYALTILELCQVTIESHKTKGKTYLEVIKNAMSTACTTLAYQKSEDTAQYLNYYVDQLQIMHSLEENSSFLWNWVTLCEGYSNFANLQKFYPIILESLNSKCEMIQHFGIECLLSTSISFKPTFPIYLAQIEQLIEGLICKGKRTFLGTLRIQFLKDFFQSLGPPYSDNYWQTKGIKMANFFIQRINETINKADFLGPFDNIDFIERLTSLAEVVVPQMSKQQMHNFLEEINSTFERTIHYKELVVIQSTIKKDLQQMQQMLLIMNFAPIQQIVSYIKTKILMIKKEIEKVNQLCLRLASVGASYSQLYRILFQSGEEDLKRSIITFLMQQMSILHAIEQFREAGLAILATLLEKCDYQSLKDHESRIFEMLIASTTSLKADIRKEAIRILGLFVQRIPLQLEQAKIYILALQKALKSPSAESDPCQKVKAAKEMVVYALGKLVKHCAFPEVVDLARPQWLSGLPLNRNISEGNDQQAFLLDQIERDPKMYESNIITMKRICYIFATFAIGRQDKIRDPALTRLRYCESSEIMERTKKAMKTISNCALFVKSKGLLWQVLKQSQRHVLNKLLND